MKLVCKFFDELTTQELYELLRVRCAVFVVEQNCTYQDLDGRDQSCMHVYLEENGKIIAYLRAFDKAGEPGTVQLGRVLTMERSRGYGAMILNEGIRLCRERMQAEHICLEAQCYAVGYYEKAGFRICSEEFLDDGIPHVWMRM